MKQYLDLLKNILENGVEKESGRANMPNTLGISGGEIRMNLEDGFPLLTTKKMFLKGMIHELLWIMRGETNIKYLVDNDVNIWNGDAYRWYQKHLNINEGEDQNVLMHDNGDGSYRMCQIDEFVEEIKKGEKSYQSTFHGYRLGDLGKVYGHQWRNQNGVDQLAEVIKTLQTNPYSRYHIINAWNKSDFAEMALPPCHLLYQFLVRPLNKEQKIMWLNDNHLMYDQKPWNIKMFENPNAADNIYKQFNVPEFYLDLIMYQRSCDFALGVPINLASMSLFLMIISKVCNMIPGVAKWFGADIHIYLDHIDGLKEQLNRIPYSLPELTITKNLHDLDDILKLKFEDFQLYNYNSHPKINFELFVGLKK